MGVQRSGTRLVAARGWSRHGQSLMRTREGVPELVGLYLAEWRREQWLGPDLVPVLECAQRPTGRLRWLVGPSDEVPGPTAPTDRPPAPAAPPARTDGGTPESWTRPDIRFVNALPVQDPPRLLAALLAAHPPTRFRGALDQVVRVLASGRYPASVVAALVDELATDEAIAVTDDVADLWGRQGRALRYDNGHGATHELVLDPAGTSYRGYHQVASSTSRTPVAPGTLMGGNVLVVRDHIAPGVTPADLDNGPEPPTS